MPNRCLALLWFLLLPLLPACSLLPTQQQAPEVFPADTLQQARQQSAELGRLRKLDTATPAQQQQIKQLDSSLQQFEQNAIRTASRLEKQGDWYDAAQVFQAATGVLPDSRTLNKAQQQFLQRRQLREERVRMELAIHRGEQLLHNAEAYQRLRQLKGPDVLSWLEQKNFQRKCSNSVKALQHHAQQALQRENYALAQRALKVTRKLYNHDPQQDEEQRKAIDHDLALANHRLRHSKRQTVRRAPKKKDSKRYIAELQQALKAGDLQSARQHLSRLRQESPQDPHLQPLQSRFQAQLSTRVKIAIKRGNELYSKGKIQQAVGVWREVQALDPDNVELETNIARAEKVLENLKALSASPGSEL
ncbi:hypothetical protein [Microbulbifer halophilus]|uniref:Tetratricopeptide repeat protein n=1 Tax=Microbulbifer halophilus TaxID=453963 RepID=A0ABW5EBN9_9GAMM|nr:hypothetical protein [Microbulbifer halophilus]MCW8127105.1 hypothetical protein [Microbulbifer halophilus]